VTMKDKFDPSILKIQPDKVAYLKNFAQISQADIVKYLEEQKKSGLVDNYESFWLFNGLSVNANKTVINNVAQRSDVEKIEYNNKYKLPPVPPSPAHQPFGIGILLKPSAENVQSNISQISAEAAWDLKDSSGNRIMGKGILIGLLDTGVNASHVDLSGKIAKQASFDYDTGTKISDTAQDIDGHGTHVAGTLVGGNASGNYIGVAPQANLVVAKIFNAQSSASDASAIGGAQWAYENGARVFNMSIGGSAGSTDQDLFDAIKNWNSLNVVTIAAIGNSQDKGPPENTESPGNVPYAIGVGAVRNSENIASFSAQGPVAWSGTTYLKPDIVAPGVDIVSSSKNANSGSSAYEIRSGTSMATPHVAGTIALILQANPSLESAYIRRLITTEATNYKRSDQTYPNNRYGYGRINAWGLVKNVLTPDVNPPVITHTAVASWEYQKQVDITALITDETTFNPSASIYYKKIYNSWQTSQMVNDGSNNYSASIPSSYVSENIYYYIKAFDNTGNTSTSPASGESNPNVITLTQKNSLDIANVLNAPNPFSPDGTAAKGTFITFYLSKPAEIKILIYDISGTLIKIIPYSANFSYNTVVWNGQNDFGGVISNGVYLYYITSTDAGGRQVIAKGKMIVVK